MIDKLQVKNHGAMCLILFWIRANHPLCGGRFFYLGRLLCRSYPVRPRLRHLHSPLFRSRGGGGVFQIPYGPIPLQRTIFPFFGPLHVCELVERGRIGEGLSAPKAERTFSRMKQSHWGEGSAAPLRPPFTLRAPVKKSS